MKMIIPCIAIVMAGCRYNPYAHMQPLRTTQSNNNDYKVDYLFEYGGCKVYRFNDFEHTVYYTNCNGDTVAYGDSTEVKSSGTRSIKPIDISAYQRTR